MEVHLRKLQCELNLITRADGSARISQGETAVTCGVYGPAEVRGSHEKCDKATIEVTCRQDIGLPGPIEHQLETLIATCCDNIILTNLHPHSAISITIQINTNDGSIFSCVFNSLCLALMDAALPMRTTFSALTCGFANDNSDDIITDPNLIEESESDTLITYIIDRQGNLLCSHTNGLFTHEQFIKGYEAVKSTIDKMSDLYRTTVTRKMSRVNNDSIRVN